MSKSVEDRIAWLQAILNDPDVGRFYDSGQILDLQDELAQLQAEMEARDK